MTNGQISQKINSLRAFADACEIIVRDMGKDSAISGWLKFSLNKILSDTETLKMDIDRMETTINQLSEKL